MKHNRILVLLIFAIILTIILIPKGVNANSEIVVAIDPGHGAEDPGATYANLKEKDINWGIAQEIKKKFDQTPGIRGVIIREYNENPSLEERARRAKNNNANLYVSIHINATSGAYSVRGAEVYVPVYKAEAKYNNYCSKLAYSVLENLRKVGVPSRRSDPLTKYSEEPSRVYPDGTRADWMGMIRNPVYNGIPSILIEHCYITNEEDRNSFLISTDKRNALADADAKAIIANKELFRRGIQYLGKAKDSNALISYKSQIQDIGWTSWAKDGETIGTIGDSKRLETLNISLKDSIKNEKLQYRVHVQDIGWMNWTSDGMDAGTVGKSKRIEAVQIKLANSKNYTVEYRVHVQDIGWTSWAKNGEVAGTTGKSKRIEAIEIRLKKVENSQKENTTNSNTTNQDKTNEANKTENTSNITVSYNTHVQDIGWTSFVNDGKTSGTTGKSKRLEAVQIKLNGVDKNITDSIEYKVHVQDIGWMPWKKNGEIAGTTGKSKRLEAIQIKLNSKIGKTIRYRVHVQDIGWMPWVKNGETAGTTGKSKRIEAIEIKIE